MNKRITTMGRLVWNEATGEGEIRLAQDFHAAYRERRVLAIHELPLDARPLTEKKPW